MGKKKEQRPDEGVKQWRRGWRFEPWVPMLGMELQRRLKRKEKRKRRGVVIRDEEPVSWESGWNALWKVQSTTSLVGLSRKWIECLLHWYSAQWLQLCTPKSIWIADVGSILEKSDQTKKTEIESYIVIDSPFSSEMFLLLEGKGLFSLRPLVLGCISSLIQPVLAEWMSE